ncbi:YbjN domain-containing protein [Candidatus Bipolaricaulota bacterium]|nr:YbjN domain-containing protein [Candidatus Bipolaricaulota bacterium]
MKMWGAVRMVGIVTGLLAVALGAAAVGAGDVLAWIPYTRMNPEYDNIVAALGFEPTATATTDPADLAALLAGGSVLLIPEQQETDEYTLEALGRAVAPALVSFLKRGGRIVGMTYGKGADDILRGAGLWDVADGYDVTGATLAIASPHDPLAQGVPVEYEGTNGSTDFWNIPDDATVIAWDPYDEAPVVFRWETRGGTVVMLGFDCYETSDATVRLLANALGVPLPISKDTVFRDVGREEIERLLTELGLSFQIGTDAYGDPFWKMVFEDIQFALFVDDAVGDGPSRYYHLQLYAGWLTGGAVPCEVINGWNRLMRGSRAYIDEAGDAVLEADLYLGGGVTWETMRQFVERFEASLISFFSHILEE